MNISGTIGCAVGLAGCAPQVDVPRWDPIDPVVIRSTLANPTAEIADDPDVTTLVARMLDLTGFVGRMEDSLSLVDDVLSRTDPDPDTGGVSGQGSGTAVFLKLACPGPDPEMPDTSFDLGHIRIDSPRLTRDVIENLEVEGDLLFTYVSCSWDGLIFEGVGPAHYTVELSQLVSSIDLQIRDEMTDEMFEYGGPAWFEPDRTRVALPSSATGTYTVDFRSADGEARLLAADGELVCDLATQECTGP